MSTRADRPSVKENTGWRLPLTLPESGAIGRMAPPLFPDTPRSARLAPGSSSPHPTATAANSAAYNHFDPVPPEPPPPVPIPPLPPNPRCKLRHRVRRVNQAATVGATARVDQRCQARRISSTLRVGRLVDGLAGGIGVEPGDGAADAPRRTGSAHAQPGTKLLILRVVEQRVPALVADQAGARVRIQLGDERARHVHDAAARRRRRGRPAAGSGPTSATRPT